MNSIKEFFRRISWNAKGVLILLFTSWFNWKLGLGIFLFSILLGYIIHLTILRRKRHENRITN